MRILKMIPAKLRALRTKAGLSQDELAAKAKVSQATIASLESAMEVDPRISTLVKLAAALDASVEEMIWK